MSKLKACPFCGEVPCIEKIPLWSTYPNGSTHGYYGCYEFDIHCHKCECRINLGRNNSIYDTEEKAKENAINAWNKRARNF